MDLLNPAQSQQNQRQQQLWTQNQVQQAHALAQALQSNALSDHPIYSPWAGAARLADALAGNIVQGRQAGAENAITQYSAQEHQGAFGGQGGDPTVPQTSPEGQPQAGVDPNEAKAIAHLESGGNYGEIGPQVAATKSHPAGYALGKYQVMNYDLANRLAAAGLPPMNEAEFLRNPDAQEKQFAHEFGGLRQNHSFEDAASMWHSGVPLSTATAEHRTDGYMHTSDYVAKAKHFLQNLNPISPAGAAEAPPISPSGEPPPSQMVAGGFGQPQYLGNPNGPGVPTPMPRPAGMGPGGVPPTIAPPTPAPAPAPAAPAGIPHVGVTPSGVAPQPQQPPATGQPIPGTMSPAERQHIFNLMSHPATHEQGMALFNEFIKPKTEDMTTGYRYSGTPSAGYRPSQVPTTPVEQPGGQHLWGIGVPLLPPGSRGGSPYGANVSPRGQAPQETGHGRVNAKGYPVSEDGSIDQERLHAWLTQGWRPPQ
jgi:hypothetical protein